MSLQRNNVAIQWIGLSGLHITDPRKIMFDFIYFYQMSIPLTNAGTAPVKTLIHDSPLPIKLNKENMVLTKEENVVTLALQGHDGANGKPGLKVASNSIL